MLRRVHAFTLVEMMVALSVTALLTVMMLQLFSDSSAIWKTEDERLEGFREARAALQILSGALASTLPMPTLTPPAGKTEEFPALVLRNRTERKQAGLSEIFYTEAYMLSSVPNDGASDLCAVGFLLEWEPTMVRDTSAPPTAVKRRNAYVLRRQMEQSDETFTRLRTALSPAAPLFGASGFGALYARGDRTSLETLASYVWDLQFSLPRAAAQPATTQARPNEFCGRELPAWIEVRFKTLGVTAARKLENQNLPQTVWNDPTDPLYQRLILPSEQQFVTRVKLAR